MRVKGYSQRLKEYGQVQSKEENLMRCTSRTTFVIQTANFCVEIT